MATSDKRKRTLLFAVKGAVSIALLVYLVSKIDLAPLSGRFSSMKLAPIVVAVGLLGLQLVVVSVRWRVVVAVLSRGFSFAEIFKIVLIGVFFNQALPTALGGDVVRAWYIHLAGVRGRFAVYSVLLDRVAALAAIAILMLLLLGFAFELIPDASVRGGFILVTLGIVAGFCVLLTLDRLGIQFFSHLVAGLGVDLSVSARKLFLDLRNCINVVGLSVVNLFITVFVIYLIGESLHVPATLRDYFVLVPPVILMSMLPVSVAGWGVRELAMVTAFGYIGVANADALLLSLGFGVMNLLVGLPGGVVWLVAARSSPPPDVAELETD